MPGKFIQVSPAYGRDYRSKDDLMAGYHAGHDFMSNDMFNSGYVNKQDHPEGATLNVRYGRGMKMHNIPFTESKKSGVKKTTKPKTKTIPLKSQEALDRMSQDLGVPISYGNIKGRTEK
jgi:hypothetical protein